jgi:hypothetical protein
MSDYVVEALSRSAISAAFPIMHMVMPALNLQAWQRFARFALGTSQARPAGILVARRRLRRHICGVVSFRLEVDLAFGRIIRARNLVGIDILDASAVILALIEHLGILAQANGCTSVHISVSDGQSAAFLLPGQLARNGLRRQVHSALDVAFVVKDLRPGFRA